MLAAIKTFTPINYLAISVLSIAIYKFLRRERRNVPPGPRGLPFVGYIPFLSHFSHLDCIELAKKYGPVFSLKLGPNNAIIINDYESALEALNNEAMRDRPVPSLFTIVHSTESLVTWRGEIWREHRRFVLRGLRSVGVGKPKGEQLIQEEINYLCNQMEKCDSDSVPIKKLLVSSTSNVVLAVTVGERYDYDHETRKMLDQVFGGDLAERAPPIPLTGYLNNYISMMQFVLAMPMTLFHSVNQNLKKFRAYTNDLVKRKVKEKNNEDLIGTYVEECERKTENKHFNVEHVNGIITSLIIAGGATLKDVIEWTLLYLAMHKDVQDRAVKEISEVIGFDREPTYSDRQQMPYVQAVIQESMRRGTRLPLNVPHIATEDTTLGQYVIPKNTHVHVNLYAIHHDDKYWKDPMKFKPERFLNEDQTKLIKRESFMPFSVGKRQCPGESLAQVELFLYVAYLLQRFSIEAREGVTLSDKARMMGLTLIPEKLDLVFKKRIN